MDNENTFKYLDDDSITIIKDGKEVECEVLFTFESDDTNKVYIGYTDNVVDENGKKDIYVGSYHKLLGKNKLEKITDPKEQEMVNAAMKEMERIAKGM